MLPDLLLTSQRVVTPEGVRPATVHVLNGKIERVGPIEVQSGVPAIDCGDSVLMPGIVDTHVHINEPGRTEWEGFATATRAAAAGGVTTLVDMPLNSIPATTTTAGLRAKLEAAAGQCRVDVGLWGGVVPGNAGELGRACRGGRPRLQGVPGALRRRRVPARRRAPICGRRCRMLARLGGRAPGPRRAAGADRRGGRGLGGREPGEYAPLSARPGRDAAEVEAVELLIRLCRETGCRVHIVHVSSAEVLPLLRRRSRGGAPGHRRDLPALPDLRRRGDPRRRRRPSSARRPSARGRTGSGSGRRCARGVIDLVATDHSPCPPEMKKIEAGDFREAWGGISSLQLALPAVWTEARRARLHGRRPGALDVRRAGRARGAGAGGREPSRRATTPTW